MRHPPTFFAKDYIGKKIENWTILSILSRQQRGTQVVARCICGKEKSVNWGNITQGLSKSCGCKINYKWHGLSSHPLFNTWAMMLDRCSNPKNKGFKYYGGRGISVCERWQSNPQNFFDDMGEKPVGFSIDRINNDGNYEPSNCRWADAVTQNSNHRKQKPKLPPDLLALPVSRQRKQQLYNQRRGLCQKCKNKPITGKYYCFFCAKRRGIKNPGKNKPRKLKFSFGNSEGA